MGEESCCYGNPTTLGRREETEFQDWDHQRIQKLPSLPLFHRNESRFAKINRTLFSFFTSFQPLTKIKACFYKYSIHMSFPNRIETKTHTSFNKSGSQLISFKALTLHETSNCPVWILYIILLFDLQFTNRGRQIGFRPSHFPVVWRNQGRAEEEERSCLGNLQNSSSQATSTHAHGNHSYTAELTRSIFMSLFFCLQSGEVSKD